jgi:hypothetical protein
MLADEARRLIVQRELYENRSEELFHAAASRLIEVEDAVLHMRPRSLQGAVFQILVASCAIDPGCYAVDDKAVGALTLAQHSITVAALSLVGPADHVLAEFYSLRRHRLAAEMAA